MLRPFKTAKEGKTSVTCRSQHEDKSKERKPVKVPAYGVLHRITQKIISAINSFIKPDTFVCDEKEHWSTSSEFKLFGISLISGLGYIWRIPTLMNAKGGLAFVVPYTIIYFLLGIPMILAHFIIGQYSGKGFICVWNLNPLMMGIGIVFGLQIVTIAVLNVVWITRIFYYFVNCFRPQLPWSICQTSWIEENCYQPLTQQSMQLCDKNASADTVCKCTGHIFLDFNTSHLCYEDSLGYKDLLHRSRSFFCRGLLSCTNMTNSPAFYFYYKNILGLDTRDITSLNPTKLTFNYELLLCNIFIWFALAMACGFGLYYYRRIAYVLFIIPYFSAYFLLIFALSLKNYQGGVRYLFKVGLHKLYDAEIWAEACYRVLYNFGLTDGTLIALSSFNDFKSNIYHNTIFIALISYVNSITVLLCSSLLLGNMTYKLNRRISDVLQRNHSAHNNIIIGYTETLSLQCYAHIGNILFFAAAFFNLFNSLHWALECCRVSIFEYHLWLRPYKLKVCIVVGLAFFGLTIPFFTSFSQLYMDYMESHINNVGIFLVLLNIAILVWFYGENTLIRNLSDMIGYRPWCSVWWQFCWLYTCPLITGWTVIVRMFKYRMSAFRSRRVCLFFAYLLPIFLVMYRCLRRCGGKTVTARLTNASKATHWHRQQDKKEQSRLKQVSLKNYHRRMSVSPDISIVDEEDMKSNLS